MASALLARLRWLSITPLGGPWCPRCRECSAGACASGSGGAVATHPRTSAKRVLAGRRRPTVVTTRSAPCRPARPPSAARDCSARTDHPGRARSGAARTRNRAPWPHIERHDDAAREQRAVVGRHVFGRVFQSSSATRAPAANPAARSPPAKPARHVPERAVRDRHAVPGPGQPARESRSGRSTEDLLPASLTRR